MEPAADVEYAEQGEGPAVLLLPGSFGTGAGWKAVTGALGPGYRLVTTSLLGYGTTPDTRPDGNATMDRQVDLIDRIIERIGMPPHVVAHSFGGLAALAHALQGRHRPASLLLIEANPFGLLRVAGHHAHYTMVTTMTAAYFADVARGVPDAARRVIDFYGGDGAFDALPARARDYVVATTRVNVRDWTSGTPFEPPIETLQSLRLPTTVVRGATSHPAMLGIAGLLHELIPDSTMVTIGDGGHFLPTSHPAQIAELIRQRVQAKPGDGA